MANQELVMETTHGRKGKCKTEFKAVVNKVLVSGLVLTTLMSSTVMPAMAASSFDYGYGVRNSTTGITYQINELSVAENVAEIRATIKAINEMRANGSVSDEQLKTLASQLFALEKAVSSTEDGVTSDVISVINEAEKAVIGLNGSGADKVVTAVSVVRAMLDINAPDIKGDSMKAPVYYAQDIGNLKGFYDLGGHEWARPAIEDMSTGTYKGLFCGKTAPNEQGLAQFDPNGTMTRAEFITVVTRALYSDQLANMPAVSGEFWYTNNYEVALNKGLITESEFAFTKEVLNAPMPRQEMALILTRACDQMGEGTGRLVSTSRISDYNTVGSDYKTAVRIAFTKGLIAGKDTSGRFAPHDTLTRAEGATVLYRLVNKSKRVEVGISTGGGGVTTPVSSAITIYEGQARYNRNAQEGDIFVKKDGTQIVLKKGPNGILGEGQGVAPDVGLLGQIGENGCDSFTYKVADYGSWYDSTGMRLQNGTYWINETTGEGYWSAELSVLEKKYPALDRDENPGSYEGQVSSDPYSLYVWDGSDWELNFTRG